VGAAKEEDVGGLDVAMNDAKGVSSAESGGSLTDNVQAALEGPGAAVFFADLVERAAFDELHDDEGAVVFGVVEVVDADGVGMLELACDDGLVAKALDESGIVHELAVHDLDCCHLLKSFVLHLVDGSHAAGAEFAEHFVFAAENSAGNDLEHLLGERGLIAWTGMVVVWILVPAGGTEFHGCL